MAIEFRSLSLSGEQGYPLERLKIRARNQRRDEAVVIAWGFQLGPEFLVLRGSNAFVETASASEWAGDDGAWELREMLIADGTLAPEDNVYSFQTDYVFQSSSLAASVILGQTASGPEEWRDTNGTKLADLSVPA